MCNWLSGGYILLNTFISDAVCAGAFAGMCFVRVSLCGAPRCRQWYIGYYTTFPGHRSRTVRLHSAGRAADKSLWCCKAKTYLPPVGSVVHLPALGKAASCTMFCNLIYIFVWGFCANSRFTAFHRICIDSDMKARYNESERRERIFREFIGLPIFSAVEFFGTYNHKWFWGGVFYEKNASNSRIDRGYYKHSTGYIYNP